MRATSEVSDGKQLTLFPLGIERFGPAYEKVEMKETWETIEARAESLKGKDMLKVMVLSSERAVAVADMEDTWRAALFAKTGERVDNGRPTSQASPTRDVVCCRDIAITSTSNICAGGDPHPISAFVHTCSRIHELLSSYVRELPSTTMSNFVFFSHTSTQATLFQECISTMASEMLR